MATAPVTTGAPTRAPLSRRGILGAFASAPMALALPILAAVPAATPFRIAEARYQAALARSNGLPRDLKTDDPVAHDREEQAYLAALDGVDTAPAADWSEFADAFEIACDGGVSLPGEDLVYKLLADVRRLKAGVR